MCDASNDAAEMAFVCFNCQLLRSAVHHHDEQDTSGAHADRLTLLGMRPIIASLSLGAARRFVVRRAVAAAEKVSVLH